MALLLKLFGMLGKSGQGQLVGSLGGLLGGGGMADILGKFSKAGMGAKSDSWVGSGANQKLTGRQVRQALGDEELGRLATENGISKRQAASGLAKLLPSAVDKLTPMGKVPDSGQLDGALGGLKDMLGF